MPNLNDSCVRCGHARQVHAGPYGSCVAHLLTESRCGCELFMEPADNPKFPTPVEKELLYKLSEECGEVIQAISKCLLYAWDNAAYNNRHDLETELGHMQLLILLLEEKLSLEPGCRLAATVKKFQLLWPYLRQSKRSDYPITEAHMLLMQELTETPAPPAEEERKPN